MKKKVFSLALVICCLAVFLTSSTLAYFTKEDTATNVITTGKIDIDLVEQVVVDPETGETAIVDSYEFGDVMPGQEVMKVVTVKNINNAQPAFIRVKVEPYIQLHDDYAEFANEVDYDVFGVDFNNEKWEGDGNGYFYYKEILDTESETDHLFTTVTFDPFMENMYQNATFEIRLTAEAVQAVNIKDSDGNAVTQAIDVPEEIWPGYQGAN